MDYQFVHSEALFLFRICVVDGILPQVDRQTVDVSFITERKSKQNVFKKKKLTQACKHTTSWERLWRKQECFASPINEAVRSGDNPAWWDERGSTEETFAVIKDTSDPWVQLYRCERTANDFMCPPLRPVTTCQLCNDTVRVSERWWRETQDDQNKKKCQTILTTKLPESTAGGGLTVAVGPVWEQKLHY